MTTNNDEATIAAACPQGLDDLRPVGEIVQLKAQAWRELESLQGFGFEDRNHHCGPTMALLDSPTGHRRHYQLSFTEETPVGRLRARLFLRAMNEALNMYRAELEKIVTTSDMQYLRQLMEAKDGR